MPVDQEASQEAADPRARRPRAHSPQQEERMRKYL